MALPWRRWTPARKQSLTAAERANLRAAVAIPAVYTASLGGHAGAPFDHAAAYGAAASRHTVLQRLRALFG